MYQLLLNFIRFFSLNILINFLDVLDPVLIGDKAKWFEQQLANIQHSTHDSCSTLVAAVTMTDEISSQRDSDAAPTDESGLLIVSLD